MAAGPLWDQFSALLPDRPAYDPSHPLGCHRPRIADRVIFEKLVQVLRFGSSYASIADCACGATTIRERRDEWIRAGAFARLKEIARDSYDRVVGLVLEELAVDGCIAKAPGGGQCAGRSPGHHRPPRRRLRLPENPRRTGNPQPERRNRAQGRQGTHPGWAALAHRAHQRLARQLQQAAALLRAERDRHQRVLRPRRHHHHAPSPHPRGLDLYRWDTRPAQRP
jgi:hypothetical protein